jgi:cytochrome c peroxidase
VNDGLGNPKNTKSLLLVHQTPPAMWLGVRETAETAVRAGIRHILFTEQPEEVAEAIDAYLKSLKAVPSPHLVHGKASKAARRGEEVFSRAGCPECHPPPRYTDLCRYEVGTRRPFDKATGKFDTPTLVELWRTAPYLHDGSAATVREVLTTRNRHDQHGKTSSLTSQELDDLCAYLLSL